jgi:hypothetical protein
MTKPLFGHSIGQTTFYPQHNRHEALRFEYKHVSVPISQRFIKNLMKPLRFHSFFLILPYENQYYKKRHTRNVAQEIYGHATYHTRHFYGYSTGILRMFYGFSTGTIRRNAENIRWKCGGYAENIRIAYGTDTMNCEARKSIRTRKSGANASRAAARRRVRIHINGKIIHARQKETI